MKKLFFKNSMIALFAAIFLLASCKQANNTKQKTLAKTVQQGIEEMKNIHKPKQGITKTTDVLSGTVYEASHYPSTLICEKDSNVCYFGQRVGEGVLIDFSCFRTVTGNSITFDFSPHFEFVKNYSVDQYCKEMVSRCTTELQIFENGLKKVQTEKDKKAVQKIINECNDMITLCSSVEHYKKNDPTQTFYEKRKNYLVDDLKKINPITATLSADNTTIHIAKFITTRGNFTYIKQ